jgi:hypothetical protein
VNDDRFRLEPRLRPVEQARRAADPERGDAAGEGAEERDNRRAHRPTVSAPLFTWKDRLAP